jgi:hypothetical protein
LRYNGFYKIMYLCGLAGSIFTFQCEKGMKCLLIFTRTQL